MSDTIATDLPPDLAAYCQRIQSARCYTMKEAALLAFIVDVAPGRPDICRDLARRLGVRL